MHQRSPLARESARRHWLAALALFSASVASAPLHAQTTDGTALSGLIVDEADLPAAALAQPQLLDLPGVRMPEALPADLQRRLDALAAQRTAIGAGSASGPVPVRVAPLPGERNAPPRRDAGDRDPDRLRTAPPLPGSR